MFKCTKTIITIFKCTCTKPLKKIKIFQCALNLKAMFKCTKTSICCCRILSPDCPLLKLLGKNTPFEITVGMNGRIWVQARTSTQTINVINAISAAEYMNDSQIVAMCKKLSEVFIEVD